jgi:ADP-heptose:LPS heptosyltransferase
MLAEKGARVEVVATPGLESLLSSAPGVSKTHTLVPSQPFDFWVFMLSLPGLLKTDLDSLPASVPYLVPDQSLRIHWQQRLNEVAPHSRNQWLRIGLCSVGNPEHKNDRYRSMRFEDLSALLAIPRVQFFTLNTHETEELSRNGKVLRILQDGADFMDTAALISELDGVISVDSAVAHLAGALNQPVWTLLPANADWRWMRDRSTSPWYPSMRLFRQEVLGDWQPVIQAVARSLGLYLQQREQGLPALSSPARVEGD